MTALPLSSVLKDKTPSSWVLETWQVVFSSNMAGCIQFVKEC